MADLTESQAAQLYSKAMKLSHAAINKHSARLYDAHVHHLACALIAGRHVQPGAVGSQHGPDRAGADSCRCRGAAGSETARL